jgi:putative flippase GtrA
MKNKKVIKYIFGGGASAVVEFFSFFCLSKVISTIYLLGFISFSCGLITSFLLNKYIVFGSKTKHKKELTKQILKFVLLGVVNSQLSPTITVLIYIIFKQLFIAKILTMIIIALWNYVLMNKFIFVKKH